MSNQTNPNQPPFRMPCEAVAGKQRIFLGSPFSHSVAPDKRPVFNNTTTVPNYNTDVGGTIAPYERWTPDGSGGDSCEVHHCVTGPNAAPCNQWFQPVPANVFTQDPIALVDFAVGRKRGFKNVQARRFWSGRFGYLNKEAGNAPDHTQCCDGHITRKQWRDYTGAVPDTKYLTLTVTAESQEEQFTPTTQVNWDDKATYSQVIDANSGLLNVIGFSATPDTDANRALGEIFRGAWFFNDIVGDMVRNLRTPFTEFGHIDCTDNSITVWEDDGSNPPWKTEVVTWDLAGGTFSRTLFELDGVTVDDQYDVTVTDSSLSYNHQFFTYSSGILSTSGFITVTATLGGANTSASVYADIVSLLALYPLNDDALYSWRTDNKVSVAPLVSRHEILTQNFADGFWIKDYGKPIADSGGATIGDVGWSGHCGMTVAPDPNTGTKVQVVDLNVTSGEPVDVFIEGFSFTDVTGYSVSGTLPPGVSFDSSTGHISGMAGADGHYGVTVTVTGAAPFVTGNILGAPLPAGYQNYFDSYYFDWRGCCFTSPESGAITWSWYQLGWGGTVGAFNIAAGCSLPLNATQWTNFFQAVNKPQGAFLFYNDPRQDLWAVGCHSSDDSPSGMMDGNALWAGKYAECLELWPSQNFALPAGDMKFWFDETKVFCATAFDGTHVTLVDPATGVAPVDGTDFTGVWGGAVVAGFFNVTSYSGGTLTLGAKVYDLPSNWASKSNGDEGTCFGKLRFLSGARVPASLLGRMAITPDMAGTTFTFAAAQPAFGMDSATHQEQVDLWDKEMGLIAANITATRIDDSHFTIESASLNAAYATITGAAKWYLNDTAPKGDYAVLEFLADLRSIGEWNRLNGITDCSSTQVAQPATNVGGGPVTQPFASFTQIGGTCSASTCLPFVPCSPKVVCISPNGETWPNGITYPFPETFACDQQYGSKWWGYVQSIMTDLFWQPPHRPCNIENCAKWQMDGGTCQDNAEGSCPGDDDFVDDEETPPPIFYYGQAPQVEARLTVPCNYGVGQNEAAPDLPAGVQIGWLSPVTNSTGDIALPPEPPTAVSAGGGPAGANTAWDLHQTLCAHAAGCRFNYVLPGC